MQPHELQFLVAAATMPRCYGSDAVREAANAAIIAELKRLTPGETKATWVVTSTTMPMVEVTGCKIGGGPLKWFELGEIWSAENTAGIGWKSNPKCSAWFRICKSGAGFGFFYTDTELAENGMRNMIYRTINEAKAACEARNRELCLSR